MSTTNTGNPSKTDEGASRFGELAALGPVRTEQPSEALLEHEMVVYQYGDGSAVQLSLAKVVEAVRRDPEGEHMVNSPKLQAFSVGVGNWCRAQDVPWISAQVKRGIAPTEANPSRKRRRRQSGLRAMAGAPDGAENETTSPPMQLRSEPKAAEHRDSPHDRSSRVNQTTIGGQYPADVRAQLDDMLLAEGRTLKSLLDEALADLWEKDKRGSLSMPPRRRRRRRSEEAVVVPTVRISVWIPKTRLGDWARLRRKHGRVTNQALLGRSLNDLFRKYNLPTYDAIER